MKYFYNLLMRSRSSAYWLMLVCWLVAGASAVEAQVCTTFNSTDVPKAIPPTSTAGSVNSTLVVPVGGQITDVNVVNLAGTHTFIRDLKITLYSPANKTAVLFNRVCGSEDNFNINFDDQAAAGALPCPLTGGGTFRPASPLSVFNGDAPNGTWTLLVEDLSPNDVGVLIDKASSIG